MKCAFVGTNRNHYVYCLKMTKWLREDAITECIKANSRILETLKSCIVCFEPILYDLIIDECGAITCHECAWNLVDKDETGRYVKCTICREKYRTATIFTNFDSDNEESEKDQEFFRGLTTIRYSKKSATVEHKSEIMKKCDFVWLKSDMNGLDFLESVALAVRLGKPLFLFTGTKPMVNFSVAIEYNKVLNGSLKKRQRWMEMKLYLPTELKSFFPT
jgi:hypothetical protein